MRQECSLSQPIEEVSLPPKTHKVGHCLTSYSQSPQAGEHRHGGVEVVQLPGLQIARRGGTQSREFDLLVRLRPAFLPGLLQTKPHDHKRARAVGVPRRTASWKVLVNLERGANKCKGLDPIAVGHSPRALRLVESELLLKALSFFALGAPAAVRGALAGAIINQVLTQRVALRLHTRQLHTHIAVGNRS